MSFCSLLGHKNVTLVTSTFISFSIMMTNRSFFTFGSAWPACVRSLNLLPPSGQSKELQLSACVAGFCGVVVSLWRPRPFGGPGEWLRFPEPPLKTPPEQTELRVLQGKAHHQRGQGRPLIQHRTVLNPLNNHAFLYYGGFRCHFYQI